MRFSIIIPVYNVEAFLQDCLDSVIAQSFSDWEAICINDGSTDGSGEILSEYVLRDKRIKVFSQANAGLSAARNEGIRQAQGDYILFLDSDDYLDPDSLALLDASISGEDMICFGGRMGDKTEIPVAEGPISGWEYYNRYALGRHDFPFVCVVLRCYRRAFIINEHIFFREGILHEDNHFTPRVCLKAQSVNVIPYSFYHYRVRGGSITTNRNIKNKESLILIGNDLSELFSKESTLDKTVVYQAISQYYQVSFLGNSREEDKHLRALVQWEAYHRVSRTKLRHRINYCLIRFAPSIYHFLNS